MNEIDWSKAPEGYPLWIEDLNKRIIDQSGWHRDGGDKYVDRCGRFWRKGLSATYRVHERPAAPSWSGEGLPPVGVVCEAKWGRSGWSRCVVFAHKPNANSGVDVLVDVDGDWTFFNKPSMFRPIRIPEQVAADEREAAICEMASYCGYAGQPNVEALDALARLYDAGYRKP